MTRDIDDTARLGRRRRAVAGTVAAVISIVVAGGCGADNADGVEPLSRADVEEVASVRFPPSTTAYRSTRDADGTTYVSCRMAGADVDEFERDGGLTLVADERVITHASPLWDLNPTGELSGDESSRDGVMREVEVVRTDGSDDVEVRMVITAAP